MTGPITIDQLARRPEHLMTVAQWIYDQWWRRPGNTVEVVASLLRQHAVVDRLPLTLVAFDGGWPVGTASLIFSDLDERPDLSPWLAAVFVLPEYRRRGIGAALVRACVAKVGELGVNTLYLCTVNRQGFYAGLGWSAIEEGVGRYKQTVMAYNYPV